MAECFVPHIPGHPVSHPVVHFIHDPLGQRRHTGAKQDSPQDLSDGSKIHLPCVNYAVNGAACQDGNVQ